MPQNNMAFLQQRIYEIGSALMYCFDYNNNRLPTSIIYALKIANGNLYAIIQERECKFFEREKAFATELKFYKKGKPFYIDVSGKAIFMEDVTELNQLLYGNENGGLENYENAVLVKIKIDHIDYIESQPSTSWSAISWWANITKTLSATAALSGFREKLSGLVSRYAH